MRDPVLAADGRTYERAAIEVWIVRQQAEGHVPTSPMSKEQTTLSAAWPPPATAGLLG